MKEDVAISFRLVSCLAYSSILKMEETCSYEIYLVLLAALGPGVYSASKRKEYRKQKNNVSGE
jgi:hypothetical protein